MRRCRSIRWMGNAGSAAETLRSELGFRRSQIGDKRDCTLNFDLAAQGSEPLEQEGAPQAAAPPAAGAEPRPSP